MIDLDKENVYPVLTMFDIKSMNNNGGEQKLRGALSKFSEQVDGKTLSSNRYGIQLDESNDDISVLSVFKTDLDAKNFINLVKNIPAWACSIQLNRITPDGSIVEE